MRHPDRVAVRIPTLDSGGYELSYAELLLAARTGARHLARLSSPGGSVAVLGANSLGWIRTLFSVALAGRRVVPINPSLTPAEIEGLLLDCEAQVLITASDFRGRSLLHEALELSPRVPSLEHVLELESWIGQPEGCDGPDVEVDPDSIFLVQYTSGTTGRPKGAMLTHRGCVTSALTMSEALLPVEHEIWVSPMPLHHVGASVAHAVALCGIGGTYVMLTAFDPHLLVHAANESDATLIAGVPTVYLGILNDPDLRQMAMPSLRVAMLGGATIPAVLVERIEAHFDAGVTVLYGQSESPAITQTALDDDAVLKAQTVGRPLPGREIAIVDPETGCEMSPGEVGELTVRSVTNMVGYLGNPAETHKVLTADGWLRTSDLCSRDSDGLVRFHGRLRDVIIRGGENIYARDVEDAIAQLMGVAQVAVVGVPDARWGESVAAFVQAVPGAALDPGQLAEQLRPRLARFKLPARWCVVDELPLTASGKVQKHLLNIPEEWT
ncbi:MAG: class I adenylate-forming enzyme family protein [Aeromicrobium sp.]